MPGHPAGPAAWGADADDWGADGTPASPKEKVLNPEWSPVKEPEASPGDGGAGRPLGYAIMEDKHCFFCATPVYGTMS